MRNGREAAGPPRPGFHPKVTRVRGWRALVAGVALLGASAPAAVPVAAQPVDPSARWHTFQTPNFQVVFHEGVEDVAFRAAERAERALETLEGFGRRAPGRIQLVVSDHVDLSNGFASVAPYPRIVIWARPPVDGPRAMPFDDWLELVVTHEVVHVLHLETTGLIGRLARSVMGRAPYAWPHFQASTLPSWGIEGVAVEAESSLTGGGRLHGGRFDAVVRARALESGGERLDQAMGTGPLFPGGERPYAYGGTFFHHLAETHGAEAVSTFFERQGTRLNPLRLNASAEDAFGASLEELHRGWARGVEAGGRALEEAIRARALAPEPELLTRDARLALYPVFRPSDGAMAWVRGDGRSELALVVRDGGPEGGGDRVLLPLHQDAPLSFGPGDTLWTTQPEHVDRYSVRSDLWRIAPDGRRTRITRDLRVAAVDVHPGHGGIVAVLEEAGTNALVLLSTDGARVRTLAAADPGVHWAHPRWSPGGDRIAVTRWEAGGRWSVGVMATAGGTAAGGPGAIFQVVDQAATPMAGVAWSPDGGRLLWSSERSGIANLYAADMTGAGSPGPVRQLTDVATAAVFPAVTPAGDAVVFSRLGGEGWELARIPFGPGAGFSPLPEAPQHAAVRAGARSPMAEGHRDGLRGEVRPWRPGAALLPRYWIPTFEARTTVGGAGVLAPLAGLRSGAADAIERNRWELELALPLEGPGRRWEGRAAWSWAGLGNPVLTGTVAQEWQALPRLNLSAGAPPVYPAARTRTVGITASHVVPRYRSVHQLQVSLRYAEDAFLLLEPGGGITDRASLRRPDREYLEASGILSRSTVRSTAFQPGPQFGGQITLRVRMRRELAVPDTLAGVAGSDGGRVDAVVAVRRFLPLEGLGFTTAGGAPPVLALRGAVGEGWGPGAGATTFRLGGGGGGGAGRLGATWDRVPGSFAVRGHELGTRGGASAWGAGAELRLPLAVLHRGYGVLPAYVDRLAAAGWIDAAGIRGEEAEPGVPAGALLSAGAELVLSHALFTWTPELLRAGFAVPIRGDVWGVGPGGDPGLPGPSVYAGVGWSF